MQNWLTFCVHDRILSIAEQSMIEVRTSSVPSLTGRSPGGERGGRRRVPQVPAAGLPGPSENIRRTATFVERYQTAVSPQPLGLAEKTGVPAMIGAMMFFKGEWQRPGVNNVEEFNPDPFMEQLNKQGLPWHEVFDGDLEL